MEISAFVVRLGQSERRLASKLAALVEIEPILKEPIKTF